MAETEPLSFCEIGWAFRTHVGAHLGHQQMSQCAGPPIKRFRPIDVISCHQFVFRLKDVPLKIQST